MLTRAALATKLAVGLLVAVLALAVLEGGLRLLPLARWEAGVPTSALPLFVAGEGPLSGVLLSNPHFAKVMSRQQLATVKPPGVKRIFILGGSAALGWPGPVEAAFSGYLQRALQQVAPGSYEVVNVAAMSYGSHRVTDFLADVVALEPDLVVVWSGSNEYVERNLLPPLARTRTLGRAQRLLRGSSLYRCVRLALAAVAPGWFARGGGADLTDPRLTPQVRQDVAHGRTDATDREVLDNYRHNLQRMAELISASGAAGVFCTVPVNLRDWVPGRGATATLAGEPARLYDEAVLLGQRGDFSGAAVRLERLLAAAPRDPLLHYLLGHSYLQLGRQRAALAAFNQARDLDQRPVRALTAFDASVREVAARTGMTLVDLAGAFAAKSQTGIPGFDLFLDHVHPNEAGSKLAALTVLDGMAPLLGLTPVKARLAAAIASDDWTHRSRYNQADNFFALGLALTNNGNEAEAEQAYLRALELDPSLAEPAGNLGVIYEARGDLIQARDFFQRALRAAPGATHAFNLASVLRRLGDTARARAVVEEYRHAPGLPANFLVILGDIEAAEGRLSQALTLYLQASAAGDTRPALRARIGELYRSMGDEANARQFLPRAAVLH